MAVSSHRRRRLALWSLLAAGFLFVNFHRTATAVLAETLARTFDATAAELGLLHASFFYIYAGLQLPSGLVVDRYGPRRVGAVGLAVMTGGIAWFAVADSLLTAFLARAVVGLGGSVLYIATLRFCAAWYRPDQYATMTGYTIAAAGVGGILATTPLALAIERVGYAGSLLATAVATAVIGAAVGLFVRDSPAAAGIATTGDGSPGPGSDPESRSDSNDSDSDPETASLSEVLANTKTVVGEPETWLLGVMLFFVLGTNFTVLGLWGVPFVVDTYGVSVARASTYVLLGNVGFVLGSPAFGWLSDRLERRTGLVVGSTLLFTLVYAALLFRPPLPVVGAVLFLALFANGGVALAFTIGKERHPPDVAGTVTGVINSMGYFGAAVLPAVMGAVLDAYWTGDLVNGTRVYTSAGYRVAFAIATAAGVVALIAALLLHRRMTRQLRDPVAAEPTD